jgi:DNA-binding MarR family transcriptional regulator
MPTKPRRRSVPENVRDGDAEAVLNARHLRHSLGYALAQATVQARKAFAEGMMKPTGLRPLEFSALMLLLSNGEVAPKALSRSLNIPAPNLTPVLDRLQRKGMLRRAPDAADGRGQRVALTAKGRRVADDAYQRSLTMEDAIMSGIKARERKTLLALLWLLNQPPS